MLSRFRLTHVEHAIEVLCEPSCSAARQTESQLLLLLCAADGFPASCTGRY